MRKPPIVPFPATCTGLNKSPKVKANCIYEAMTNRPSTRRQIISIRYNFIQEWRKWLLSQSNKRCTHFQSSWIVTFNRNELFYAIFFAVFKTAVLQALFLRGMFKEVLKNAPIPKIELKPINHWSRVPKVPLVASSWGYWDGNAIREATFAKHVDVIHMRHMISQEARVARNYILLVA